MTGNPCSISSLTVVLVVPAAFRKQLKMFVFWSFEVQATIPTVSLTWTSSTETLQVHKVCWQNETSKCILEMIQGNTPIAVQTRTKIAQVL